MKKIAVAQMNESEISMHFGRSPLFGIYTIMDGEVKGIEMRMNTFTHHMKNDHGADHAHSDHGHENRNHSHNHNSIVNGLADCQVIISGGMGMGAINNLSSAGKEIIITDEKLSENAVKKYSRGELKNLNKVCDNSLKK